MTDPLMPENMTHDRDAIMQILLRSGNAPLMAMTLARCVCEFFRLTNADPVMKDKFARLVCLFEEANQRPLDGQQ